MDPLSARLARLVPDNLPVAENVGLVRAVTPQPAGFVRGLAAWYLPGSVLGLLMLAASVPFGQLWLGALGYLLAVLFDRAATLAPSPTSEVLSLGGWNDWVRTLVRQLLFVGLLATGAPAAVPWFIVFVVVLHLGWLAAHMLSAAAALRQPVLGYVPGAAHQPTATQTYARIHGRAIGVTGSRGGLEVVAVAVALLGAGWPLVAGYCAAIVVAAVLAVRGQLAGMSALASAGQAETALCASVASLDPTAVAYLSGGSGQAKYLLNQWLPALAALPEGACIVVRESSHLRVIDETPLPVLYAATPRAVERCIPASARVAFYFANSGKNIDLLANTHLGHVFLGHGDSDKSTSATPIARVFDQIWVAGPIAIGRYAAAGVDIPPERFAVIGRPQIEGLLVGPLAGPRRTVLYAPTFEGYYEETNYSSLEPIGPALIAALLARQDLRVLFKPHPSTGLHRAGMRAARAEVNRLLRSAGGDHRSIDDSPGLTLLECFDQADVLISDVSSVVSDFLYTQRPVVVTNPKGLVTADFVERSPSQAGSYLLTEVTEIGPLLDDALTVDSMRAQRLAVLAQVLGEHPHGPTASFVAAVRQLAATVDQR